jgi:hypothetical protein
VEAPFCIDVSSMVFVSSSTRLYKRTDCVLQVPFDDTIDVMGDVVMMDFVEKASDESNLLQDKSRTRRLITEETVAETVDWRIVTARLRLCTAIVIAIVKMMPLRKSFVHVVYWHRSIMDGNERKR